VQHEILDQPRSFVMQHVYYGPAYSDAEILKDLEDSGARWHRYPEDELVSRTVDQIANGKIVGWFQGRMEFGPRALGNRSILADPRRHDMKDILNSRIKYRETFRPFCPSILAESVGEYFETDYPSPFMVMAYKIKAEQRDRIPAVTHGDGTGRLQTVEKDVNPLYWKLIRKFEEVTGAEARASGMPRADLDTNYIRVTLPRPVPKDGQVRLLIDKTYKDGKSYFREGDLIVFSRPLGIKRNSVVLPVGYELVSCNVPAQVATEDDGRIVVSFVNTFPGPAAAVIRGRRLR
jgi:hypothetical protein